MLLDSLACLSEGFVEYLQEVLSQNQVVLKLPIILKKLGLCRAAASTTVTINPIPKSKQGRDITRPT